MSKQANSPFQVGMVYRTVTDEQILIVDEANVGTYYHTVVGHDMKHRYTDSVKGPGRCKGTDGCHDDLNPTIEGLTLDQVGKQFVWDSWLKKVFEHVHTVCDVAQINFVLTAHIPTDEHPNHSIAYGGLNDDAPETMKKIVELIQSREVIEDLHAPDSACNTDSVSS